MSATVATGPGFEIAFDTTRGDLVDRTVFASARE